MYAFWHLTWIMKANKMTQFHKIYLITLYEYVEMCVRSIYYDVSSQLAYIILCLKKFNN